MMAFRLGDILQAKGQTPDGWARAGVCAKKHRHKSKGAAEAHIRAMRRRTDYDGAEMDAYQCPICQLWHIGRTHKVQ